MLGQLASNVLDGVAQLGRAAQATIQNFVIRDGPPVVDSDQVLVGWKRKHTGTAAFFSFNSSTQLLV